MKTIKLKAGLFIAGWMALMAGLMALHLTSL